MADPVDKLVPLVREIGAETAALLREMREMRAENAALHEQTRAMIQALDKRLGVIESIQNSHRQVLIANTLLGKLMMGGSEEWFR
jgi:hypothetical protein